MRYLPVSHRPLADCLSLGPALVDLTERSAVPVCTVSTFAGEAIVLGALQVAGRVLREPLPSIVARRTTSGTAAYFARGGLVVSLALPSLDCVFKDATPATILNRNLRLLLAGFAHASIPTAYFGREWLSHRHRPVALVGLDVSPSGVVLLEVFASLEGSFALPRELVTDLEASCDRYRAKVPLGLAEASSLAPIEIAEHLLEGIAERMGSELVEIAEPDPFIREEHGVVDGSSPLQTGSELETPNAIPIGYLDRATDPTGRRFVGGDALGPVHAMGFGVARATPRAPIVGATWTDFASSMQKNRNTY